MIKHVRLLLWQFLTAVYFSSDVCVYRKEGKYCFETEFPYPWLGQGEPRHRVMQSTSELWNGIISWIQYLQLCYDHKRDTSKYMYRKGTGVLIPLISVLLDYVIFFFSQKANTLILIGAVPWVLIGDENSLAQQITYCYCAHSCSVIEDGR